MERSTKSAVLWGGVAAFSAYFCMYAFRKPFTAVTFGDAGAIGQLDYKVALVIAQVLGYALSKFVGIRVIAELSRRHRDRMLIGLIVVAELALVGLFLVRDSGWAVLMLFLNGLPLGLIWGIVFSYLEGRRLTEILGAALSVSFIVSSGVVKSVGAWLVQYGGVSDYAMPALTGTLFLPPLLLAVRGLERMPPPDAADVAQRCERRPLDAAGRAALLRRLGPGLIGVLLFYLLITILRDVRDNFAAELWTDLGYGESPAVFALSELPVGILCLLSLVVGYFIHDNERALRYYHALFMLAGLLTVGATLAFSAGMLPGAWWLVAVGAGLYLAYVPLNAIYFDRLVGAFRETATAGFLIYVADAAGYSGTVAILLVKNFSGFGVSWLTFYTGLSYTVGLAAILLAVGSWLVLERRLHRSVIQTALP